MSLLPFVHVDPPCDVDVDVVTHRPSTDVLPLVHAAVVGGGGVRVAAVFGGPGRGSGRVNGGALIVFAARVAVVLADGPAEGASSVDEMANADTAAGAVAPAGPLPPA